MSIDRDNPLAAEIQQEIAQNYFAACRKMVEALEALKEFDNGFDSSSPEVKAARRSALLEQARAGLFPRDSTRSHETFCPWTNSSMIMKFRKKSERILGRSDPESWKQFTCLITSNGFVHGLSARSIKVIVTPGITHLPLIDGTNSVGSAIPLQARHFLAPRRRSFAGPVLAGRPLNYHPLQPARFSLLISTL